MKEHTLDEVEVLGDDVFAVVHNEDASDVEFDVVALLLGLEEIERRTKEKFDEPESSHDNARYSPLGNEEDSLELELTLDGEVLDGEMVFPVVGQALVERAVLLSGDVLRVAGPDGLHLVEHLPLVDLLLDLLGLLLLVGVVFVLDLFNLGVFAFFLGFLLILDFL